MPEHVEERREDAVLHVFVPGRRQPFVSTKNSGNLAVTVFPRGNDRQEDIGTRARNVSPASGTLLIQGRGKPVGPEEVEGDVAHQLVPAGVGARLHAMKDVCSRRGLHLEVASDHAVQLFKSVNDRQVKLRDEVGRKHNSIVTVDNEWLHGDFLWQAHRSSRTVPHTG